MLVGKARAQSYSPFPFGRESESFSKSSINYIALGFFGAVALAGICYAKERSHSWPSDIKRYTFCLNECREMSDALTEEWKKRKAENNQAMTCTEDMDECDLFSKDRKQFRFALHEIVDKCFADCKVNS